MEITREQLNSIVDFVVKFTRSKAGFIVTPTGTISVHQHVWDWLEQPRAGQSRAAEKE